MASTGGLASKVEEMLANKKQRYQRFGKKVWGMGSVYLRLKKRHPDDKGAHILQAGEGEKDLGLEAAQDLALDDSEDEEEGDLTIIAKPSSGDEPATHDTEGAAA